MFKLKYNGVEAPKFLKVTGVDQSILPTLNHFSTQLPSGYGDVDGGVEISNKQFKVSFKIIKDLKHDDSYYIDMLALWLMGNDFRVSKLELDDSGEYYMARPVGQTDLTDEILLGSGVITFVASNPRRYMPNEETTSINIGTQTQIVYNGIVPVYPVFTIKCTGTESIKIINKNSGEFVLISGSLSGTIVIDCNKKFVSVNGVKDLMLLHHTSDWVLLKRGTNSLEAVCTGSAPSSITMTYREIK